MRTWLLPAVAFILTTGALAQTSTQDLPSAPSATLPQRTAPAPKPAAPEPQTQPTTPSSAPAAATSDAGQGVKEPAPQIQAPAGQNPPQTTPEDTNEPTAIFRSTVNEVNVIFTAVDRHGRFVKNLKQEDVRILDDGRPPKAVDYFKSETDLPLRVGLLIDASNSIRDRFHFEQESAIEFLNQIIRRKSDLAFTLGFDSASEVTQDFTDDTEKLSRGVRMLRPGGGTALYDAVYYACRDKLAEATSPKGPVRKAIILLTDGDDNQSRVTREEAVEMAQRAEVIIYAISTNVSGSKNPGDKVLERFAETTGGRVFFPYKIQDVADAFTEIQDELRSQYVIAYRPQNFIANGKYRPITIEPSKNKTLKVRTRKGYYAPKNQ